jgi:hypothetical protein
LLASVMLLLFRKAMRAPATAWGLWRPAAAPPSAGFVAVLGCGSRLVRREPMTLAGRAGLLAAAPGPSSEFSRLGCGCIEALRLMADMDCCEASLGAGLLFASVCCA